MQEGDIILTSIPQADGQLKNRPAVILRKMPLYGDLLVCGISTQLRHYVDGFDEIISPIDTDFRLSGLWRESLIRLGFLVVLPRHRILGSIGEISLGRHNRLMRKLSDYLIADLSQLGYPSCCP